ncbi:hypothetical protein ETD86_45840 [Nonomuraea turkmeniaca]|uniref:Uncharacterized protein n=1 Tax=Nonomuraea turkmeniaca TaxID=103838 RepID=A0A5S4EZ32_9ACTN|nr:hypothetical protein [Nonomuraea turkmeniaca]TMR08898.1 hypothetical protein ETD86_45840 [Nonomuraea turkmeniaca]
MAVPLLSADQRHVEPPAMDWRFPLDDASQWSKATRTLAELEPGLLADLAALHAHADADAAAYDTMQLAARLADAGHPVDAADQMDRGKVVTAYRALVADSAGVPVKLAELRTAALREQQLAERLNGLLADGENADRHMRATILNQGHAFMAEDLMRSLEELLPRQLAGAWAARVAQAHVEYGADIAAAAKAVLRPAARALVHLVHAEPAQPRVIAREAARAKGAHVFCRAVMGALELNALPLRWGDL